MLTSKPIRMEEELRHKTAVNAVDGLPIRCIDQRHSLRMLDNPTNRVAIGVAMDLLSPASSNIASRCSGLGIW
ncbi:uncharacterized protein N7483_004367 [Penicillium malachiteum]|uniref:uncharacterized protein n=1 Tax=Penicillium malachiteum TaxID=1324776 RepID=UPI002547965E|nr:uncharacterized protein N7483_004367 [Penicillium malachiteum]KAJ5729859.1 hypothetical protein N7483_004367 [Penicillium malachiteum]